MLVAANLRAPITSVGVALPSIKDTLHTTNSALSLMTVVPLIAFGVVSFLLQNRQYIWIRTNNIWSFNLYIYRYFITVNNWIELALYWHNTHWHRYCLWQCISTAIVKTRFPFHIGIMTGLYTVVMNVVGSLSSSAISPLTSRYNYAIALGLMSIITLFTIIIWTFQLKQQPPKATNSVHSQINIWKSLLAWRVTILWEHNL